MGFIEILLTGFGLAMDAFAVSICKGLSMNKFCFKKGFIVGIYFGLFQGLMPLIGYLLGMNFKDLIISIDHWIAFSLLLVIGVGMLKEGLSKEVDIVNDNVNFMEMIPYALATSIDALAVGITLAFLRVNILLAVLVVSIITFVLSIFGVWIGNKVGNKYQKKSQVFGGFILIFIGFKILIEHLI